jgi:hypothetical protein
MISRFYIDISCLDLSQHKLHITSFLTLRVAFTSSSKSQWLADYQDDDISLNDGDAPTNLAILCLRKTSCSFPQSLHRSLRLPEMLLYFGFTASSSSISSITFPQSHEIRCFGIGYVYKEEELKL